MKVLYISKYIKTPSSGGYSRQYLLSKHLAERGNDVQLVTSRSNGSQKNPSFNGKLKIETEGRLEIITLNGPLITLGFNLKRVWSWILFEIQLFRTVRTYIRFKPQVVIVSSLSILTFLFGVFIKKRLKIPLILEVRDLYPLSLIEVGGMSQNNLFVIVLGWIEKFGYKNADKIISTLENTHHYFEKCIGKPVDFKWLPMGFEDGLYAEYPDESSDDVINYLKTLKASGKFIVGYAGSIGKANALDEILILARDNDIIKLKIHFVFIGDGPLKQHYQHKFNEPSITFLERVPKIQLPLVLKECDILINTWLKEAIYSFGISPNKWIDYMYSGRPIILALDATSKIFQESNCGWQIDAQSAIMLKNAILLAADTSAEELDRLGSNGKTYLLKNLNYVQIAEEFEITLKSCL